LEFYCKDGSTILLDCKFQFIRDEQGNATGILAEGRDITKRKQAEVSLGKSEEKYRSILENMREGYFEVDLTGNFTFLNDSVCQILGYPIDELMGMNNRYYTDKKISKKVFQAYNKVYNTEETLQEFGWQIIRKDGAERYVEGSISLQKDSSGKPIGFRGIIRDITERKRTEDKLQQTLYNLKNAVGVTIQVMVSAVEMRDPYTAGHQLRSANLACAIATEMGLSQEKVDGISMAGSIHDIGKLSIPAEILSKPTKLTDLEFSLIKEHSRIGYEMLKDVEFTWPLAQIVYQHHERMDGSGYPRNLKGEEILMEARIMAVADVVEAMASHRPYRAALGIEVALGEIEKNKGIFYDDAVADACLRLFREKGYKLIA
jgi:PAS domain S-box-containing protein